jgi:hypothetical protein
VFFTVGLERGGKTIFHKTLKNLMHHEGMYAGVAGCARGNTLYSIYPPTHFAFISAGSWTSATKTGAALTEFTAYTTNGGATRPASTIHRPTTSVDNESGVYFARLTIKNSEVIEFTGGGTLTGLCLTRSAVKGSIPEMYFSLALSLSVVSGDKLSIYHKLVVEINSDLH